jgi:hypothetical protein
MEQAGASGPDGFANTGGLVGWEVIEDHHVALRQDDREERADMGKKGHRSWPMRCCQFGEPTAAV